MTEFSDVESHWESLLLWAVQPFTAWQASVVAIALGTAWLIGRYFRSRLESVIRPGAMTEGPRTAVRTGVLALVPLIGWALLFVVNMVFRRRGWPTDLIRPAMLLVGALVVIRGGVFVLRHSFSPGSRLKAWEGVLTGGIWLLLALHVLGWLPPIEQALDEYAVTVGSVRVSIYTVVSFALSIAMMLFVALGASNALHWRIMKSEALDASLKLALTKLGKFVLLILAVLTAMLASGIDITALAVFGGALGVGIGLGLQRIVSNFVSGVVLAFEGSVRPGDIISSGKHVGTVQEMHARHVVVHTRDGFDVLIPNENLLTGEIINWSLNDRRVRLSVPISISYRNDPERAIALLEALSLQHPRVLADPAPVSLLKSFGDDGIDLELQVWVSDPEHGVDNVRSDLNRKIWSALQAAGMTIPYPQREVRILNDPAPGVVRTSEK